MSEVDSRCTKSYPSDVGNVRALIKCDIRILFAMFAGVIFCNYHHQQEVLNEALSKSDSLQFIFFFLQQSYISFESSVTIQIEMYIQHKLKSKCFFVGKMNEIIFIQKHSLLSPLNFWFFCREIK